MKKKAYLVIVMMLACLCAAEAAAQAARVDTGSGSLNMRRKADAESVVVERIPNGFEVEVGESEGEWSRITYRGKSGYVKTKYLSFLSGTEDELTAASSGGAGKEAEAGIGAEAQMQKEPPLQAGGTAWISTGKGALNMRKKADAKSVVVAEIPDGARVQVEEAEREWTRLTYQGKTGYVKTAYLRLDSQMIGKTIYPDGSQLLLREAADEKAKSIASIHASQPMTILSLGDAWLEVSTEHPYAGPLSGYIRLADVSRWKETPDAGVQPFCAHMTISAQELALGDVLDIAMQYDAGAQCVYTLYRNGEAILRDWPSAYDAFSYRAKASGEYRLVVDVRDAQGNALRCERQFTVLPEAVQGDNTILYSQKDGWWLDKKYGRSNLDQSGCAIFTLSAALRLLGFGDEATGAQLLAQTYPMYLTESGTVTENLLAAAARDFGFTAGKEKLKKEDEIAQLLSEGAVFSFSVASGHIALAAGLSEDGTKVKIIDSAPGATFERIEGARMYARDEQGGLAAAETLWDIPGAKYYFETNDFGGLEYYLDLSYVARRGVRMIARRK